MQRRSFGLTLTAALAGLGAGARAAVREPEAAAGGLTDLAGLKVGHFTDPRRPTGCTVVLAEQGAACGVDVRGGAPGTRETDLLDPVNMVERVHAVVLAGGSAFGLEAASGVARFLEQRGVGFPVGAVRVPIVPAAILFDLQLGDARLRPDAAAGEAAARSATAGPVAEGNVGAGAGCSVGKIFGPGRAMKAGLGSAAVRRPDGVTVAALVAVNALGDVVERGVPIAGARTSDGLRLEGTLPALLSGRAPQASAAGENTTLGVVATNVALTKAELTKVAQMAHDGLARTLEPVHTPWDGDTLFALSTGERPASPASVLVVGSLAAEAVARAVLRAARAARGLPGLPAAAELERG